MLRFAIGSLAFTLTTALVAPAGAGAGELAGLVTPIAEVQQQAERGDYVVVEGHVARVTTGSGSRMIVIFEDRTGSVPMAVPNHLLRHFAGGGPKGGAGPSGVTPQVGRRARVGGKWDHAYLDDDTWGIAVQNVEPIED